MLKENMRIKENITLMDKIDAVESIVSSYFQNGDYTPYYADMAEIIAVVTYFIEGITLEDNDNIYDLYEKDDELHKLVNRFISDDHLVNLDIPEAVIMCWIRNLVYDKVEYLKENIIHSNPDLDTIVEAANVIIDTCSNFSKLNLSAMSPEDIELGRNVLQKINDSGVEITPESITEIIRDAVGFDIDKASAEIIDAKNVQIKEKDKKIADLQKYKEAVETKNVLVDN